MPGKKGMKRRANTASVRQMLWRSMRILQRFTITGLMRTIPDGHTVTYTNVLNYICRLIEGNYVAKEGIYKGGRAGSVQSYRLINNIGPTMPVFAIAKSLSNQCKKLSSDTQAETETDTQDPLGPKGGTP